MNDFVGIAASKVEIHSKSVVLSITAQAHTHTRQLLKSILKNGIKTGHKKKQDRTFAMSTVNKAVSAMETVIQHHMDCTKCEN